MCLEKVFAAPTHTRLRLLSDFQSVSHRSPPKALARVAGFFLSIYHLEALWKCELESPRRDTECQWPHRVALIASLRSARVRRLGHQGRSAHLFTFTFIWREKANLRLPGVARKLPRSTQNSPLMPRLRLLLSPLRRNSSCWLLSNVRSINSSCCLSRLIAQRVSLSGSSCKSTSHRVVRFKYLPSLALSSAWTCDGIL